MNLLGKKKSKDSGQPEGAQLDPDVVVGRTQEWTSGSQLGSRVWLGVLIFAIGAGPIGGWIGYQGGRQAEQAAAVILESVNLEVPDTALYGLVEQAGQETVEAWLSATRDDHSWIDSVLPGQAGDRLPAVASAYSSVMPVKVVPGEAGLWSVTIAASVEEPVAPLVASDPSTPTGETAPVAEPASSRRYYMVTVQVDAEAGTAAAVALPAPVGAPPVAELPRLPFRYSIPFTSEIPTTIGSFLEALLAGSGEVDRYLTPGADVDRLASPAYLSTAVREVLTDVTVGDLEDPAEGAVARVLVHAELTRFDGMTVPATYVLDLTSRSGRWEITAITTPITTEGASTS